MAAYEKLSFPPIAFARSRPVFANFVFACVEFTLQLATLVMDEKIVGEKQDNVRLTIFHD